MILLNLRKIRDKIDFMRLVPFRSLQHLPSDEQDREEEDLEHFISTIHTRLAVDLRTYHEVREQKVRHIPHPLQKYRVSTDKRHDERADQRIPRRIRLQHAPVRQRAAIQTLRLARLVEPQERKADDAKVDQLTSRNQADEPVQHDGGVLSELEERQERNHEHERDAVDRYTLLCAAGEELGCFSFQRETEERARRAVDVRVACGEGGGEDTCVDDVRESLDAQTVHGDDVRRGGGTGLSEFESGNEVGVVVGDVNADRERTEDEESSEAIEDGIVCARHDFAGVFGLTSGHGDVVWAGDGEGCLDETLEEAEETSELAFVVELGEGSWVLPVPEAVSVLLGVTTQHRDEGED